MPENLICFVIAHSQQLIVDFHKRNKQFIDVDLFYILVGTNPNVDLKSKEDLQYVTDNDLADKIFIPCFQEKNIEERKELLAYTAWHYIVNSPFDEIISYGGYTHVGLFEYDIDLQKNISSVINESTCSLKLKKVLHFVIGRMDDESFLKHTPGLIESINNIYDTDIVKIISRYYQESDDQYWGETSNLIVPYTFLKGFVKWYTKLIPEIVKYKNCAHFHERAIKIYSILNQYRNVYSLGLLKHQQLGSHGISL